MGHKRSDKVSGRSSVRIIPGSQVGPLSMCETYWKAEEWIPFEEAIEQYRTWTDFTGSRQGQSIWEQLVREYNLDKHDADNWWNETGSNIRSI